MRRDCKFEMRGDIVADRESGMTYEEIGKKYGVTRQRVGQICGKYNKYKFRVIKKEGCIYKNLREWMNKNSVDRSELLQEIGIECTAANLQAFRYHLRGLNGMSEEMILGLTRVTGINRDLLFQIG